MTLRDQYVETIEAENAALRERIANLESALTADFIAPLEWNLTAQEERVFGVIYGRELCTRDAILSVLYRDIGRDEADAKIVDVFVCKIRAKLKPWGVSIGTAWGRGYYLTAETRALVRAAMQTRMAAA